MAPSRANEPRAVITFHSPIRTFNRIFSENSLQEMKDVVRKKLGLSSASPIHLDHLQGDYCIALEDDDDFNAFHLLAKTMASLVVRVIAEEIHDGKTIATTTHLPPSDEPTSVHSRKRNTSKAGFTSQNSCVNDYASPSAESSPAKHGKRKRIADEDSLKDYSGNSIALESAPAADVTASPERKKQKRSIITAGTSDSISDVDMLNPSEQSSGAAPKKRKEEVSDSTSNGPTSGDLHLSANTVKSKKSLKASIKPDRTDGAEKDSPPAVAEVQVSKKTRKKKATEAESLHGASSLSDPDVLGASKSSAKKAPRVSNSIKKSIALTPEIPVSESLSTATKKGKEKKEKKEKKTVLPNEAEAEETVVDAYDKFFRSVLGRELDHEVPSPATLSSKNAKKRPIGITKPGEDSTKGNRIGRKTEDSDETSNGPSTLEVLKAARATVRAALAQRRNPAAVNDAVTTDISLSTDASKATSPIIASGPPTAIVQVAKIKLSSTSTSKQKTQSRPLKKVPLHAPLERHSSLAASPTEIDVFGPVTSPASVVKTRSGSGLKNNSHKRGTPPGKSSFSRDVPMHAMICGDDEELRALIRGPQRARADIGQILSAVAAGGDGDDVAGELEEDEEIHPKYRSFTAADASSSEEEIDDDSPDVVSETDRQTSVPLVESSSSREPSAADGNDVASKDAEQRSGDDRHPVNSITVPDAPEEFLASPIPPKSLTEPDPVSPIGSFDEPQQSLQTHVESPPRRPNGLLKRMKGKSASLSPQQSRLRPPMLSKIGKLNGVSEGEAAASQLPPTQYPASLEPVDFDNVPPVSPSKLRRQSLDTWATLKPSSPNTDPDSSINIDELVSVNYGEVTSSTPNDRRPAFQATSQQIAEGTSSLDSHDSQPTDDPLFLPSESQHPFPYTQYQAVSAHDSEDEDEVEATVKSGPDITASSFRRLTDIGSQRTFFSSQPPGWQKADFSRPTLQDLYGGVPDDESGSSDGDSDDGSERTSHIPQSRRAGAK
ncbi:hypothetical protein IW261DRAFT_1452341 [Armillaria novae-zelandiae]|uniref:Uncharacterized protein n=1 Tax=Armillaria novae-zelandiae TaxID=153914 RepID=A0AA39PKC9_9AGAR|nr:hypothetical protein IW261DRAFT_1452341 [Armillaria novae-zelandiae]